LLDREDKAPKGSKDYYASTIRELPQFALLELIPMRFQDDTHYLAGRPDAGR
jgi:hypothetical protein